MSIPDPVAVFRTEAAECLEQIEQGLLDLTHDLDRQGRRSTLSSAACTPSRARARCSASTRLPPSPTIAKPPSTESARARFRRPSELDRRGPRRPRTTCARWSNAGRRSRRRRRSPARRAARAVGGSRTPPHLASSVAGRQPPLPAKDDQDWRMRFSLPANAMVNGTNPLAPAGRAARSRRMQHRRRHRRLFRRSTRWIRPNSTSPGTSTLKTEQARSAIEDVFIFVMDDMQLEISGGERRRAPVPRLHRCREAPAGSRSQAPAPPAELQRRASREPARREPRPTGGRECPRSGRTSGRTDGPRRRTGHRPVAAAASSPAQQPTSACARSPKKSNVSPASCATR